MIVRSLVTRFIFTSLFLFFCSHGYASALPEDSLKVKELFRKGEAEKDSDPVKATRYFQQSWRMAQRIGDAHLARIENALGSIYFFRSLHDSSLVYYHYAITHAGRRTEEEATAYIGMSQVFTREHVLDSSRYYLDKALLLMRRLRNYAGEADVQVSFGNIYLEENNHAEALARFVAAAELYDSLAPNPVGYSRSLMNIGNVHNAMGDPVKALAYLRKGVRLAKEHQYDVGVAYGYKLSGRIYRRLKKYDSALFEYKQALLVYERMGSRHDASEVQTSIGNIYTENNDFKNACIQYEQALTLARSAGSLHNMAYAYSGLGVALSSLGQSDKAILYMDSSRVTAQKHHNAYLVMDAYEQLSLIEKERKDFRKALAYHEQFTRLKDSITLAGNVQAVGEIEAKYQTRQKQAQIELLQKDQQLKTAALQRLGIALFAILVIAFLLINRYRIISRTRRQMELESMRGNIARDLHDDIGSTLSSINIVSQQVLRENTADSRSLDHFRRISEHSERMMESMSDIVWSIHPQNDSWDNIAARMKEFTTDILDPLDIDYSFTAEEVLDSITLNAAERKNLFLIFKECINNLAKYSRATRAQIRLSREKEWLLINIVDNGIGFDREKATGGNGLYNMKQRAETAGGRLTIETSSGQGTSVQLRIPLPRSG